MDKLYHMIDISNEKSDCHRILTGLLDIHLFLIKNTNTPMCSYVNEWSLLYKTKHQYKKYVFEYFAVILITFFIHIKEISVFDKNSKWMKSVSNISFYVYKTILKRFIKG